MKQRNLGLLLLIAILLLAAFVAGGTVRTMRNPGTLEGPCIADQDCKGNEKDPPNFLKCVKQQCKCDHKHVFRNQQCVIKADMVFLEDQFDLSQPCVPFAQRVKTGDLWICACQPGYQYFEDECHSKDAAGRSAGMGYLVIGVVSIILISV